MLLSWFFLSQGKMVPSQAGFDPRSIADEILASKKYRKLGLTPATVLDLLNTELPLHHNTKDALKEVRRKLHNIVAPYLGDPDYLDALEKLEEAFLKDRPEEVRAVCSLILAAHASTHERLAILDSFYPRLFAVTGKPAVILDLACGLNPFSFPWMGLPETLQYHVYDINQSRIDFINRYFTLQGLQPLAALEDILVNPPQIQADVAFFFKEAHRFEQRQRGCNLRFWQALRVHYLLVSLPTRSLNGKHSLLEGHRNMVYNLINSQPWKVTEILFENELVFCIDKSDDAS
jgi:16S rRNA (guanine(1405)-N(7))-methyltransferase